MKPEVLTISDLVQYQEAAIVSRTLIKGPKGTVTIFAFDGGEYLSEHTTPYDALVQVVEGEFEIHISGEPYSVAAGHMLLMPAQQPHALRAVKPSKMMLIMIHG